MHFSLLSTNEAYHYSSHYIRMMNSLTCFTTIEIHGNPPKSNAIQTTWKVKFHECVFDSPRPREGYNASDEIWEYIITLFAEWLKSRNETFSMYVFFKCFTVNVYFVSFSQCLLSTFYLYSWSLCSLGTFGHYYNPESAITFYLKSVFTFYKKWRVRNLVTLDNIHFLAQFWITNFTMFSIIVAKKWDGRLKALKWHNKKDINLIPVYVIR